ncbi:MAG: phenylalanine--tRNA ligase subunit alpha [candidate division Zixibacteria bacterium]|nr:phenylalanine--tRNA ligase subunit alpha [candidate division Zixibacteria bacterium]
MIEQLQRIENEARNKVSSAKSVEELEKLRVAYLGKKGELTTILRGLKSLSPEEKKEIGGKANKFKSEIDSQIKDKKEQLADNVSTDPSFDYTLPGRPRRQGHRHLITITMDEVTDIFQRMGFEIAAGPEIESDYYNFEALNFPPDHPARDEQDTFYTEGGMVLRTHTSGIQIREFEKRKPPVKIIAPGRVYRNEAVDAGHFCVFHQVEGFYADSDVTFGDLKGVLEAFCYELFEEGVKLKFRPSFFPFTEPSAEVDVQCVLCGGKGCSLCKYEGWLEILGCGMIDPEVFKAVGYDPEKTTGYAFGMGIERLALLKYRVNDIRLLYENDTRFIKQFR